MSKLVLHFFSFFSFSPLFGISNCILALAFAYGIEFDADWHLLFLSFPCSMDWNIWILWAGLFQRKRVKEIRNSQKS